MNVFTSYFLFETQSINFFFELFTLLVFYDTLTKQAIFDWTNLEINSSAGQLSKQTNWGKEATVQQ